MRHTLTAATKRRDLIELAERQVKLGEDCTRQQQAMFRSAAQSYCPAQDPRSFAIHWASVIATTKLLADLEADVRDACFTYAGIEFPKVEDWTYLENETITDRNDALDTILQTAKTAAMVLEVSA